jgi:hypothetical protein
MNRRVMLVFGALAVLAAAVILYLAMHTPTNSAAEPDKPVIAKVRELGSATGSATTASRIEGKEPVAVGEDGVKEYVVDGVRVRDHRKGERTTAVPLPRVAKRPDGRQLAPAVVQTLNKSLQAVLAECVAQIPKDQRGNGARLEGVIQVDVKNHKLGVTEATMQLSKISAPEVAGAVKQCMEQKSAGISADAPDEADVERYALTVSFAL